jgi:hypothetical protein
MLYRVPGIGIRRVIVASHTCTVNIPLGYKNSLKDAFDSDPRKHFLVFMTHFI